MTDSFHFLGRSMEKSFHLSARLPIQQPQYSSTKHQAPPYPPRARDAPRARPSSPAPPPPRRCGTGTAGSRRRSRRPRRPPASGRGTRPPATGGRGRCRPRASRPRATSWCLVVFDSTLFSSIQSIRPSGGCGGEAGEGETERRPENSGGAGEARTRNAQTKRRTGGAGRAAIMKPRRGTEGRFKIRGGREGGREGGGGRAGGRNDHS